MKPHPLVSVNWLKAHLTDPDLIILDASMKKAQLTDESIIEDIQIPGARFFDIKGTFSDDSCNLPNMIAKPEVFETECRKLGINRNSKIVVYDKLGIYSSPRAWWMFKTMGHDHVQVLDGGLLAWIAENCEVESKKTSFVDFGNFEAKFQPNAVKNAEFIIGNIKHQEAKVLDARSEGRFKGIAPEPRKGLKGGHIPQSVSLPYSQVLRNGKFLPKDELASVIDSLNLGDAPLVFSCGSGITACIILLACEIVMDNEKAVYDGSWTEWGEPSNNFPVAN